jgi:hypothetical protein
VLADLVVETGLLDLKELEAHTVEVAAALDLLLAQKAEMVQSVLCGEMKILLEHSLLH